MIGLQTYWKEVEPTFQKVDAEPPSRLHPKYFSSDGSGTPVLDEVARKVENAWVYVSEGEPMEELLVVKSHARGDFWEGSDFDVEVVTRIGYVRAKELERLLKDHVIGKGTPAYEDALKRYQEGERDFVDCYVGIVDPPGRAYDLIEKRWVTFGKGRKDYEEFLQDSLGLDPELFNLFH